VTRWSEADVQAYEAGLGKHPLLGAVDLARKPKSRYTNKPEVYDGVRFDSQAELRRYKDLRLMQDAGAISGLEIHPRYDLYVGTTLLGYIELDFAYIDRVKGEVIYEDVKAKKKNSSSRTPIFSWKRRHLFAQNGITVTEVVS
jgi:hypothetical protein